jgi:hypothetical protein
MPPSKHASKKKPRPPGPVTQRSEKIVSEAYHLFVDCRTEAQQRKLYEQLTAEGWSCRVLTL